MEVTARSVETLPEGRAWRLARTPVVLCVLALAAGLAMVFAGFHSQSLVDTTFDPYRFGEMGKSVARGDGFTPFGSLLARRAPVYPLLIGGIYYVFGEQPGLVLVAQCLLLAGTSLLAYATGRQIFNERTGVIAALVTAFNPMLLRYVADLQLEILLSFLFTLTVWCACRFYQHTSVLMGIMVGVSAGLTALTKPVVLPFPVLFAATIMGLSIVRRRRGVATTLPWRGMAAMLGAMIVVIAPWTARNYFATGGHFVLVSSGTSDAFLRGYIFSRPEYALLRSSPYVYAENESNTLLRGIMRAAGTEWERDDYETEQILNRAALQVLTAAPIEFFRKFTVGILTFWYQMTSVTTSIIAGLLALATWAFALVGLLHSKRESRPAWILILPAMYLNVFLAALLALGRYSVPILPPLLIVSAYGIDRLLSVRGSRHRV